MNRPTTKITSVQILPITPTRPDRTEPVVNIITTTVSNPTNRVMAVTTEYYRRDEAEALYHQLAEALGITH